jgi:L-seryl-tRNA(Ser) seleniumtransferase
MELNETQKRLLRGIPGIDHILEAVQKEPFFTDVPKSVLTRCAQDITAAFRKAILEGREGIGEETLSDDRMMDRMRDCVNHAMSFNLKSVVNATGVVVHTNLGRSLLAQEVMEHVVRISSRYSNLEFDLAKGRRGSRYSMVEDILCEISGAEAGMAVNNNAGAVLLCLDTIARGREVIVSRGELVEIGGSFRIPDVMARSGAVLREVGTTNRTHLRDYEGAVCENTGLLLKVHQSNYCVVGFTAAVSLKELAELGIRHGLPVMEDLGSGTFIDFSRYGMVREPTVQDSVSAGADIVTFSGDKLLGGPQAGLIVGKKEILDSIKKNPLTRALRIDKMTLAALEATLRLYRDPEKAARTLPTLRMLTCPISEIELRTLRCEKCLKNLGQPRMTLRVADIISRAGGGALPLENLPSKGLGITVFGMSASAVERSLRGHSPPIIGRIEDDEFILDFRTVQDDDIPFIEGAFAKLFQRGNV